jgi:hypothetical protein
MRAFGFYISLLALPLLFSSAPAEETLPKVLIIGDSVYSQLAAETTKALKGKVDLVYAVPKPDEVCNSETALKRLDEWLGQGRWDLIHFNVGLGDLVFRAPGLKAFRLLPRHVGGVRTTSPRQYESNLVELVTRLGKSGVKLVWASTTPIRHSSTDVFEKGSEIEYNSIAAKVMADHGIPINDMYTHVLSSIDMTKPAGHGADPFFFDKKPIHTPIVEIILHQLDLE